MNIRDWHEWVADERRIVWHGGRQVNAHVNDGGGWVEVNVASQGDWWGGDAPTLAEVDTFARDLLADDEWWDG